MPQFGSYPIVASIELADTILILRDSDGTVVQISFEDFLASINANTNGALKVTYLNADTVLDPTMGFVVVNSGSNVTLTLPLAAASAGIAFSVLNKGAGHVTIDASGSDTIAGQAAVTLLQYESAVLRSDGSSLYSNSN